MPRVIDKLCVENTCYVLREDDGAGWVEDGVIHINLRWVSREDETVEYIRDVVVHEVVEHMIGAGHDAAVVAEKIIGR